MTESRPEKNKDAEKDLDEVLLTEESQEAKGESDSSQENQEKIDIRQVLYLKELESKVATYESKLADIREYVKKLEDEVKQIRFRAERDSQKTVDQNISKFFTQLLPIVDNFERSLKLSGSESNSILDGLKMIFTQLQDFLAKAGLEKIDAKGATFDPHLHEAVSTRAVDSKLMDDVVVDEAQSGYRYKDQVIRPAQVVVGRLVN